MPAGFSSLLLRVADLVLVLLLFVFRLMGYMYAKYFLRGSFSAKHLFKSTASTDTGDFFNPHRSTCAEFDTLAVATQLLNVCVTEVHRLQPTLVPALTVGTVHVFTSFPMPG